MMNLGIILFVLANSLLAFSEEESASLADNSVSSSVKDVASSPIVDSKLEKMKNVEVAISRELTEELSKVLQNGGSITSVLDEYADKILANIAELIISNGFDPVELPNATMKVSKTCTYGNKRVSDKNSETTIWWTEIWIHRLIPTGQITLNDGWLQDLSTIARFDSVTSTYKSSEKLLIVTVPIKFDTLLFTYKYHTHILLLNLIGDVSGKLECVKIHVTLKFNFNNYRAELSQFDMRDTGRISVKFSGLGLVDWITNTMTSVVSLFLHPIIIAIITSVVKVPLNAVVDVVNQIIVCILTPVECSRK